MAGSARNAIVNLYKAAALYRQLLLLLFLSEYSVGIACCKGSLIDTGRVKAPSVRGRAIFDRGGHDARVVRLHELRVSNALVDERRLAYGHVEEFLHGLSVRGDLSSPRFITHIQLAELIQV